MRVRERVFMNSTITHLISPDSHYGKHASNVDDVELREHGSSMPLRNLSVLRFDDTTILLRITDPTAADSHTDD